MLWVKLGFLIFKFYELDGWKHVCNNSNGTLTLMRFNELGLLCCEMSACISATNITWHIISGGRRILYLGGQIIYIIEILRKQKHFQFFIYIIKITKTCFFFKIWGGYSLKFYKNTYKNIHFENFGGQQPHLPPLCPPLHITNITWKMRFRSQGEMNGNFRSLRVTDYTIWMIPPSISSKRLTVTANASRIHIFNCDLMIVFLELG